MFYLCANRSKSYKKDTGNYGEWLFNRYKWRLAPEGPLKAVTTKRNMEIIPTTEQPWDHIEWIESIFSPEFAVYSPSWEGWEEMDHDELNGLKAKIDALEEDGTWELRKKLANPYELVHTYDEKKMPICLAIPKPLSRSYFKMIEMLQVGQFFEKLPKGVQKLRSSHVAEGPGGFIEAFLDKAEANRLKVQKSFAITLKPTNNHVPGWRRSYQFLQRHPEVKIHYGADGTGDIYLSANQSSFIHLHETIKSHLFTGDGGFDFSTDYENQEKSVYPLLVSTALIGIQVLQHLLQFVL